MMKKATAIFFLLVANIVILVHAVVPHHHHENQICIEINQCQPNCDAHQHEISQKDCHHPGESSSQNCLLKQVVYLPSNQEKQDCKWLNSFDKHSQSGNFHAVLVTHELIFVIPDIISNPLISSNVTSYSNFVSTSKGLRAPPVV